MSTGLELFADHIDGDLYVAITQKSVLIDLYVDPATRTASWASLYLGRVMKLDTRLNAAIVEIGDGLTGLLPAKHIVDAQGNAGNLNSLRTGQSVLVQVKSEARRTTIHESRKMPRLSMKLYMPGIFTSHHPAARKVVVADKLMTPKVRALVTKLTEEYAGTGWMIREYVDDAADAEIAHELRYHQELWRLIDDARNANPDRVGMLRSGPNALLRALFDYSPMSFDHIYVGNKELLEIMTAWCGRHFPALATSKRLRLFKPEKPGQKLFDIHDIYGGIEALEDETVFLPSGGSIIIEQTSAMIVIDVNQGSASSILTTNREAADEVVRQCHLRNLSGAILVDFIGMDNRTEAARLVTAMRDALGHDAGSAAVHGFTRLGIVEMTRKRRTASLVEKQTKTS